MDIEARDSQGRTPLHYAAMFVIGDDPSAILIESGIKNIPNFKCKSEYISAISCAFKFTVSLFSHAESERDNRMRAITGYFNTAVYCKLRLDSIKQTITLFNDFNKQLLMYEQKQCVQDSFVST